MIEKYLTEAVDVKEKKAAQNIKHLTGPIRKIEKISKITFILNKGIDEDEIENFSKIDNIMDILKRTYPTSIIKHDYDKFIVEEL